MKSSVLTACLVLALPAFSGCATLKNHETVSFQGLEPAPRQFAGVLTLPEGAKAPVPVVVLVHGSAGVDSRYEFHRPALLEAGIGTFEVDFKTGVFTSLSERPPMATFHPWAFGALKALRVHPQIDATRIGIMGFSLGGHLSVSVASRKVVTRWLGNQPGFAAHVGFYPVCKHLKENFDAAGPTGAPILIFLGEKDSWSDPETCKSFCDGLNEAQPGVASLTLYPDVHHGFDRKGSWKGYAPFAKNNTAILQWNGQAAHDSRRRAVAFLRRAFGLGAMKTHIRRLRQDDIPFVQPLIHELGYPLDEEEIRFNIDQIHRRNGIILVAEFGGKVVGCLSAVVNTGLAEGMFGEIVSLVVAQKCRGIGIGTRLVAQAEEWLKPQVGKIRIRANSIRLEAHQFYRSLGYTAVKTQVSFMKYV